MLSGLLLLCAGFAAVSAELDKTDIFLPFNSSLSLICNHTIDPPWLEISWKHQVSGTRTNTALLYQPDRPLRGYAIPTLVSFQNETGDLEFIEASCYEHGLFKCNVDTGTDLSTVHHPQALVGVHLGQPAHDPLVTVTSDDIDGAELYNSSSQCTEFTVTTDTVTVETSISSRPKVNVSINGHEVDLTCSPYGPCNESGQVRCEMMETLSVKNMGRELRVEIVYLTSTEEEPHELLTWKYCANFDVVTTKAPPVPPSTPAKVTVTIARATSEREDGDYENLDKERQISRAVILKITTTCIICSVMIAIFCEHM